MVNERPLGEFQLQITEAAISLKAPLYLLLQADHTHDRLVVWLNEDPQNKPLTHFLFIAMGMELVRKFVLCLETHASRNHQNKETNRCVSDNRLLHESHRRSTFTNKHEHALVIG